MKLFVLFLSLYFYSSSFAELDKEWWKHTIIYEMIPYTFKDSDGDGNGDFKGILSKLDHFENLKIETLHMTPIYKTTLRDFGYDISDYYNVEPKLGTMDEFEELVREMKKRNMKLILDLVINHSGHKHGWFQKSVNRIHPYTDYYVWKDPKGYDSKTQERIPPNNWKSIFTIENLGSAWTWNEKRKQYYFHQFLPEQPDFDLNNENLKNELKKMMKFWLDKGVAGFRLDATPFFFEDKEMRDDGYENRQLNQPETLEFIHDMRLWLDQYNKIHGGWERIFIAEAHCDQGTVAQYYDKPNYPITHFPYTFLFELYYSAVDASSLYEDIKEWMALLPKGGVSAWMTQDHDGARVGSRILPEYADLFTMISMILPGTVGVYYGQEIAMENGFITENQIKDFSGGGARDPARLIMQWDDSLNAGFSNNIETFLPPNSDYFQKNVAIEKVKPVSHYKLFKDLSTWRKTDIFKYGDFDHDVPYEHIYTITRSYRGHRLTLIVNTSFSNSRVNLLKILNNPPNKITVAAASTNAEFTTGYAVDSEAEEAEEFQLRPLSALLFKTTYFQTFKL